MSRRPANLKRAALFASLALFLGAPAEAYYHYIFYANRTGSTPIPVHFNLAALPNNTVTFFVNDTGPNNLAPNDTFGSVLGEVKQALAAWNAVPTSALRIAFGGVGNAAQPANTPGGQVIFTDLGPGLLGLGTPNVQAVPNLAPGQTFVPITRSLVELTNNTNSIPPCDPGPGPSYCEAFFTTAVHEIGHSLGLQHTWTGSAMSQAVIRNTSRARPLDADDIASLSELYGNPGWTASFGSISGTVRFNTGQPVTLASVVAIADNGPAVSALTNPDGTYTIDGLPPNSYRVYVHPLPPDAIAAGETGLQLPQDPSGATFNPSPSFRSIFYPGTVDANAAQTFTVTPGSSAANGLGPVNFTVTQRSGVPAYDLVTMSYLDPGARNYTETPPNSGWISVTPAFVNSTQNQVLVYVVANAGLPTPQTQLVTMLGMGNAMVRTSSDPGMFLFFNLPPAPSTGPRHLVFNYGNDMYVLPNAVNFVQEGPPYVNSVNANGDGTLTVSGSNFGPDDRVFVDGLPAAATFNAGQASSTVTPPAGGSGQTSTVTVFASDGQNSLFSVTGALFPYSSILQPQNPPTYTYPSYPGPQIQTVTPNSLPAGFANAPYTALVDITGANTRFVDGQVTVGFGTNDVNVNRVWVLSPTHLVANVVVAPGAAVGSTELSVISGFNVMTAPSPFLVLPPNTAQPLIGTVVNPVSGQQTLFPGPNNFGVIYGLNLATGSSFQATLNGAAVQTEYASPTQVNFYMPAGFPAGPAVLTLNSSAGSINLIVPVGNPPVAITAAANANSPATAANLTTGAPPLFSPGDTVNVQVNGLDPAVASNLARVQVTVSGLSMPVTQAGGGQVQFVLTQSFGGSPVPVVVLVDGSPSAAFTVAVR